MTKKFINKFAIQRVLIKWIFYKTFNDQKLEKEMR